MTWIDYVVLAATLLFIVAYGTWKTRQNKDIHSYLLGGKSMNWLTIGLSVMATQASAITFLSTPGLAYDKGMAFVQNYFGLPIALIIVSAVFIPLYYKLRVYTAYEFLEKRFDLKSRLLAAFLFLLQRGLAAGITIYAPAIVLSSMLGWNLSLTILVVGILVIIYTVSGGTRAVSITQKWQMAVIMTGMFVAFYLIIDGLPDQLGFVDALELAGKFDKTEAVNFRLDFSERYTFWSGITGGLFLALSYFGTDQSQVQRYLGGKSVKESRLGLMFNAALKIPMQFFILLTGVMVFVFFQFEDHEVLFDKTAMSQVEEAGDKDRMDELQKSYSQNHQRKKEATHELMESMNNGNETQVARNTEEVQSLYRESKEIRGSAKNLVQESLPTYNATDSDYVFLTFIMRYMPTGLVGLLLAVIISAAMSSTAGELNALGSTTSVDFYKRLIKQEASKRHYVVASKLFTMFWGIVAISFALLADLLENLIEAVNILGSIFYGTILGIFLVAFFIKWVRANAVFWGAVIAQLVVILLYFFYQDVIAYLYYNVIGCGLVLIIAPLMQLFWLKEKAPTE